MEVTVVALLLLLLPMFSWTQQRLYARVLSLRKGHLKWASRQAKPCDAHMMESGGRPCLPFGYCRRTVLLYFTAASSNCSEVLQTRRGATRNSQHGTDSRTSHAQATTTLCLRPHAAAEQKPSPDIPRTGTLVRP